MTNSVVLWFAGVLGWPAELIVILATLLVIFGTVFLFQLLVALFSVLLNGYNRSSGPACLIWLLGLIPVGIVVVSAKFILGVLAVIAGISLANDFRDWWHKGPK